MTEKELLQKIQFLKEIKPNKEWADLLLTRILEEKPTIKASRISKLKTIPVLFRFPAFSFRWRVVFATFAFLLLFSSSFALAQYSLPGSPLYPLKQLTYEVKLYLAKEEQKPEAKIAIVEQKINDLIKVTDGRKEEKTKAAVKEIKTDLAALPQDLKKIAALEKSLAVSQKVQNRTAALQQKIVLSLPETNAKKEMENIIEETRQQVLAVIWETEDKINRCPSYITEKLEKLNVILSESPAEIITEIPQIYSLLEETQKALDSGDCLTALENLDKIKNLQN